MKDSKKPAKGAGKQAVRFTDEERAAMKEYVEELKGGKGDGESALLAKVAEMKQPDRAMAERIHAIVKASAPHLESRTWYGMPAYARDDKVVCFFQGAAKFKTRYATLGFSDKAKLDDGSIWPVAFALGELTPDVEKKIAALLKKAAAK